MNHDTIDATFYAAWQSSPTRYAYTVTLDGPIKYAVEDCLRVVLAKTPDAGLLRFAESGLGVVCLYESMLDQSPFARAVLSLKVVPKFSLKELPL